MLLEEEVIKAEEEAERKKQADEADQAGDEGVATNNDNNNSNSGNNNEEGKDAVVEEVTGSAVEDKTAAEIEADEEDGEGTDAEIPNSTPLNVFGGGDEEEEVGKAIENTFDTIVP